MLSQVGVFTDNPQTELDVNGDITISKPEGELRLESDNGNSIDIRAAAGSDATIYDLPRTNGNPDEYLTPRAGNDELEWEELIPVDRDFSAVITPTSTSLNFRLYDLNGDREEPGGVFDHVEVLNFSQDLLAGVGGSDVNLANDLYTVPEDGFYFMTITTNPSARPGNLDPGNDDTGNFYPVVLEIFNSTTGDVLLDTAVIRYETTESGRLRYSLTTSGVLPLTTGDELEARIVLRGQNKPASDEVDEFRIRDTSNATRSVFQTHPGIVFPRTFRFATAAGIRAIWTLIRI